MSMTYTTLTGAKTEPGSILNFVNYTKVPVAVVLEEAEALIFQHLRVREMRTSTTVSFGAGASTAALPAGFLEAISMRDREGFDMIPERFVDERGLIRRRVYTNGVLESGTPMHVAIFDELFQFDCKAEDTRTLDLAYFKRPAALAADNQTNFLTTRYPHIVRVGCQLGAASFSKDTEEEAARLQQLISYCQTANAESDMGRAA